jgi:hypothetical protein
MKDTGNLGLLLCQYATVLVTVGNLRASDH